MKKIMYLMLTLSAVMLTGCAGGNVFIDKPSYVSSGELSYANNVAKAAYIDGIKDGKIKGDVSIGDGTGASALMGVSGAALSASIGTGIGTGWGSFGIAALPFLLPTASAERVDWLFRWKPYKGESPAEVEAQNIDLQDKFSKYLNEYMISKMGKSNKYWEGNYTLIHGIGDQSFHFKGARFSSKECENLLKEGKYKTPCGVYAARRGATIFKDFTENFEGSTIVNKSPDFTHLTKSIFTRMELWSVGWNTWGEAAKNYDPILALAYASKKMGNNTFIYLSVGSYPYRDKNGNLVTGKMPLIINQGKVYLFLVKDK